MLGIAPPVLMQHQLNKQEGWFVTYWKIKEERKNSYFLLLIIENSTVNQQFLEEI